jgi:hypothetical protein
MMQHKHIAWFTIPQIKNGELDVVGPIFPEDIKAFTSLLTSASVSHCIAIITRIPLLFRNQNLVTMTPPLEYHAKGAATILPKAST